MEIAVGISTPSKYLTLWFEHKKYTCFIFVGRNSEEIERKSKDRGTQIFGSPQDLTNHTTVDTENCHFWELIR